MSTLAATKCLPIVRNAKVRERRRCSHFADARFDLRRVLIRVVPDSIVSPAFPPLSHEVEPSKVVDSLLVTMA